MRTGFGGRGDRHHDSGFLVALRKCEAWTERDGGTAHAAIMRESETATPAMGKIILCKA